LKQLFFGAADTPPAITRELGMSAVGNLFWKMFDGQSVAGSHHHDALVANRDEARADLQKAGAYFASPFTTIRDAYKAEPNTNQNGWKKLGMGILTGLAFVPLAVRGLIGGAFYGLLALKNGGVDAAAHGIATMWDTRQDGPSRKPVPPAPGPAPAPGPTPVPNVINSGALKPGRVQTGPVATGGGVGNVQTIAQTLH
jgi:hypothetical protein